MKKFVVSFQWSQTESGVAIVFANNRQGAEKKVKEKLPELHHITGVSQVDYDFT